MNLKDMVLFEWKPGISIPCRSQEHLEHVKAAHEKLGPEAFSLLMQARGWAARWLDESDPSAEAHEFSVITTREFIDRVDDTLGLSFGKN